MAVLLALATALATSVAAPSAADGMVIFVSPQEPIVNVGDQVEFRAYTCPSDADGRPQIGPDGEPDTDDDSCEPVSADPWSIIGDIGTLDPTSGTSTTFTAALPAGVTEDGGAILATVNGQTGATSVFVVDLGEPPPPPPPTQGRLAFLDGFDEETTQLSLLQLGPVRAIFLASLTTQIARREARGREATSSELRLLDRLVTADDRHRLVARDLPPETGSSAVVARVTSFDASGDLLDVVDVVLEPFGNELRMLQEISFIDRDTRQPRLGRRLQRLFRFSVPEEADGLVFLTAEAGGRVIASAQDLQDAEGDVIDAP